MASQDRGIHSFKKEVITLSKLWEEEEALPIRREDKTGAIEDQALPSKEDPSSNEEYEEIKS